MNKSRAPLEIFVLGLNLEVRKVEVMSTKRHSSPQRKSLEDS